jgi:hypothetical protein
LVGVAILKQQLLVHVPNFDGLDYSVIKKAVKTFDEIGRLNVKPLYLRIKERDEIQRKIDEIAMEMLGIDFDLNKLYEVLANELGILSGIRTSKSRLKSSRREELGLYQVTLDEF